MAEHPNRIDNHSMKRAEACQRKLETQIGGRDGVLGIGIGLSKKGNALALKVLVADKSLAGTLPKKLDDIEIDYDVVGSIKAL